MVVSGGHEATLGGIVSVDKGPRQLTPVPAPVGSAEAGGAGAASPAAQGEASKQTAEPAAAIGAAPGAAGS